MRAGFLSIFLTAMLIAASLGMAACEGEQSHFPSHSSSFEESSTSTASQQESSVTSSEREESSETLPPNQSEATEEEPETSAPSQDEETGDEEVDQSPPAIEGLQIKNGKGQLVHTINGFTGQEYVFFAEPTNQGGETRYTVTLSAGVENATLTKNVDNTITFQATDAGEYVLYFISEAKDTNGEEVRASLKLIIAPFSLIEDFFDKSLTYTDGESTVTVDYVEDWEEGRFYISHFPLGAYGKERYVDVVLDYAYDAITGELKTTLNAEETSGEYFLYREWEIVRKGETLGVCTTLPYLCFGDSFKNLTLGAVNRYDYFDGNDYTDEDVHLRVALFVKT